MMNEIAWTNVRVKLGDLKPWADNPRMSSKRQAQRILESFRDFGQVQTIAIGPDCEVYDGHQRLSALLTVYGANHEIDARQSSRALTEDERKRLTLLLHAGATGSWNWDVLGNWDTSLMVAQGINDDLIKQMRHDAAAITQMLRANDLDDTYASGDASFEEMFLIVVTCESEAHQRELLARFNQEGLRCRALIS